MSFVKIPDMKWKAKDEHGGNWWASNLGYKFVWVYDSGTGDREKAGGGELLARHFFKQKHQERFLKIFGKKQFQEMCVSLKEQYDLYLNDPTSYNKANHCRFARTR